MYINSKRIKVSTMLDAIKEKFQKLKESLRKGKDSTANEPENSELSETLSLLVTTSKLVLDLITISFNDTEEDNEKIIEISNQIIKNEQRVDRLKEQFTENLFHKKRFLSSMQKIDNVTIIEWLDDTQDQLEIVARYFQIYNFKIPSDLEDDMIRYTKECMDVVSRFSEAVGKIYTSFKEAKIMSEQVQNERREARESQWKLLESLFKLDADPKDLIMIKTLIRILIKAVDRAEGYSDGIRRMAIKYMVLD